jgi:hypothetical protein
MPTDNVYTNLDLKTNRVRNLSDPALAKDAATKDYVDNFALGGDLSGTLAAAVVAKLHGVALTGTPALGDEIIATSSTTATWQTPAVAGRPLMAEDPGFDALLVEVGAITDRHFFVVCDGDGNAILVG